MLKEILHMLLLLHDGENIVKYVTGVRQGVDERTSDALQR